MLDLCLRNPACWDTKLKENTILPAKLKWLKYATEVPESFASPNRWLSIFGVLTKNNNIYLVKQNYKHPY